MRQKIVKYDSEKDFDIDVAVLLIFFNRPGCFSKVFAQVKKARPSRLFLYQDGARKGVGTDIEGIKKCREIALDIDWKCEVFTLFQEENIGCDPSEYIAQKWAFSHVDKCIVLEDDDVPAQSFFRFCKELLDKYENDERINMICGMNNLESVNTPYSYLFTETGSIWGWATWKRVVDSWEGDYALLSREYDKNKLLEYMRQMGGYPEKRLRIWETNKETGVEHYETILGIGQYVNHRLNIVPAKNMILNIGNNPEGGTHSVADLSMIPKGLRKIFTMGTYDIQFPLQHPPYIINDVGYQKNLFRVMGVGHPLVQLWRNIEKVFLLLKHMGLKEVINKVKRSRKNKWQLRKK